MPTFQETITQIKNEVVKNIPNAIKQLSDIINPKSDESNDLILIEQQFSRLKKDETLGLLNREENNREHTQFSQRLLNFISNLKENDVLLLKLMQYETHEYIHIITKNENRKKYMEQFFPETYFKNVTYDNSNEPKELDKNVEIVIYDDSPTVPKDTTDELLKHYLQQPNIVVLYFGRFSPLVFDYPEKAYATNSVFSIQARIKEMIEYLKYNKAYKAQK